MGFRRFLGLVAAFVLVPAAGAGAAEVRLENGHLRFTAGPGEANRVDIEDTGLDWVFTDDDAVTVQPGPGCYRRPTDPQNVAACTKVSSYVTVVDLGDGDDEMESTDLRLRGRAARRPATAIRTRLVRSRDRRAPYRFTVLGLVRRPSGMAASTACAGGRVSVRVVAGRRTISSRRVTLRRTCRFASTVVFRRPARLGAGRLRFVIRFLGTRALAPRTARALQARAG